MGNLHNLRFLPTPQSVEDFPQKRQTPVASHEHCEAAAQDSRGLCVDSRDIVATKNHELKDDTRASSSGE